MSFAVAILLSLVLVRDNGIAAVVVVVLVGVDLRTVLLLLRFVLLWLPLSVLLLVFLQLFNIRAMSGVCLAGASVVRTAQFWCCILLLAI